MGLVAASPCVPAQVQPMPLYLAIQKFIFTTGFGVCGEAASSKSPFKETGVKSHSVGNICKYLGAPKLKIWGRVARPFPPEMSISLGPLSIPSLLLVEGCFPCDLALICGVA